MCWMCDNDAKSSLVSNFYGSQAGVSKLHYSVATGKFADGMYLTGHSLAPPQPPALILIGDSVPGDTSTTATLTVGAPHTIGTTETIGDEDFYRVELVAGQSYEIGMYAYTGGPGGVPQADAYVEIYDGAGNLLLSGDGGAPTLYNNLNSGFDVLMTFTAETSGTYFINARAYDEEPTNGTNGDTVGDYELFVQEASPFSYQPYYDIDSPLHSIDWGSQVDGSSRNPDGQEGPRETGNAFTGHAWNPYGIEGKNVITYYFAKQGEVFIDENPATPGTTDTIVASGFEDWEKDVYLNAFGAYSQVADIVYVEVDNRAEADFVLITYEGTPGPGVSLLGRMSPPDEENEGRTEFNAADQRWTEEGLAPGGFSFTTLIHEFGHGHGLAHPHDNGGQSSIMRGVEADGVAFSYTNGDFDLNQSVYTMMSYEDGWEKSPYGQAKTTDPYGWLGSLMAFDIAAIQDKYGVNEEWATGNDTYTLKDVNAAGTFYSSIWDAGGIDEIVYGGARNAAINLQAATLQYEYGGGGWISYAYGIHGGFTIANGVTIENATSGSGHDSLTGNGVANVLNAGSGNDHVRGFNGNDTVFGGRGNDVIEGGGGADTLFGGLTGHDTVYGGDGNDYINGGEGNDYLHGGRGADIIYGDEEDDRINGSAGADTITGGKGADTILFDQVSVDGSTDRVNGFNRADGDKIDLSAIDANGAGAGSTAFTFIGGNAFSGTAGELRLFVDANGVQVAAGDVNGDGAADFAILFANPAAPIAQVDFVL